MAEAKDISLVCKISPTTDKTTLIDYLLSNDFCAPLHYVNYQIESNFLDQQNVDYNNHRDEPHMEDMTNDNVCLCLMSVDNDLCTRKVKIRMDMLLFSCVIFELKRSRIYRSNILSRFNRFSQKKQRDVYSNCLVTCPLCKRTTMLMIAIVYLDLPVKNVLDYKWSKKIDILVNEKCELENAMAWLSTLGGAFSALGDEYIECAEKAAFISVQQFRLALRLGDPITICRCKIYLAMSLLQREQYSKTKRLIRELYKFAVSPEGSKDFKLKNMCIAVWNRLKYVLALRRNRHTLNAIKDN